MTTVNYMNISTNISKITELATKYKYNMNQINIDSPKQIVDTEINKLKQYGNDSARAREMFRILAPYVNDLNDLADRIVQYILDFKLNILSKKRKRTDSTNNINENMIEHNKEHSDNNIITQSCENISNEYSKLQQNCMKLKTYNKTLIQENETLKIIT